jgi:hypothetical protein
LPSKNKKLSKMLLLKVHLLYFYGPILQGISAREAYRRWASNKDKKGSKYLTVKVRRGEEPFFGWIFEWVKELESQIEKEELKKSNTRNKK